MLMVGEAKRVPDSESRFAFSWIALNALCGMRSGGFETEWWKNEQRSLPRSAAQQHDDQAPGELEWILWRMCSLDIGCRALRGVIEASWGDVQAVVGTRYLMSAFWSWKWQDETVLERWEKSGARTLREAIDHTGDREKMYRGLREIVVWRLRVLRNQIFHGCATDTHSKRRAAGESELEAGSRLLGELVWSFLKLMVTGPVVGATGPPSRFGEQDRHSINGSMLRGCLPLATARCPANRCTCRRASRPMVARSAGGERQRWTLALDP